MSASKKWVVIASHKTVREFHAKSFLAYKLANAGYSVILGRTGNLRQYARFLPKALYIDVGILSTREYVFQLYKELGFKVAAFCEEATALNDQKYVSKRVDGNVLAEATAFFAWSERHADIVKGAVPLEADKVHVTGHPRYDLLTKKIRGIYKDDVESLREKHGPFILINTNSGDHVLSLKKQEALWESYVTRGIHTEDDRARFEASMDYRRARHKALMSVLPVIKSAYPNHKIILRPHFNETESLLRENLPVDLKDIDIIHEGSVIPWLLATEAMIHSNCSTAIEAYLLGCPSISYREVESEDNDSILSNLVSYEARTKDEFSDILSACIESNTEILEEKLKDKQSEISYNIRINPDKMAADEILDCLQDIDFPRNISLHEKIGYMITYCRGHLYILRTWLKKIILKRKFSVDTEKMTKKNLAQYINQFESIFHQGHPKISALSDEIFFIRKSE